MYTEDVKKEWKEFRQAWNTHDVDVILSYFTDDCIYEDAAFGVINRGREEVKAFLNEFFNSTPDLSLEINEAFIAGDWGGSEWVMSGTNLADFMGFPASGRRYTFRGASITEYENGKIKRNTDYYDLTSILQQIGYLPDPDSFAIKLLFRIKRLLTKPFSSR